jgi:hypothetical protein
MFAPPGMVITDASPPLNPQPAAWISSTPPPAT